MRIVLTGSGSGGHFYPLMAIAEALNERAAAERRAAPELYLLAPDPYDEGVLFKHGVSFAKVPGGKIRRYFSLKNLTDALKTFLGLFVALYKLFVLYPDVVVSKGSYTSVPVVLAAFLLRIPVVVHESDVQPGRANRLAMRFAKKIAVSYQASGAHFPAGKTVLTGIPIRTELFAGTGDPHQVLGIPPGEPLILVLGGSQGAERINDLVVTALDELLPNYAVLHQTGESHLAVVSEMANALVSEKANLERYYPRAFFDVSTLGAAYRAASLIVSRAGSTSIHEIALAGKPAIIIPIPEEVSHDQRLNAYEYARTGAATVIEEKNLTPHLLASEIARIMGDQPLQMRMQEAAKTFAPVDAGTQVAAMVADIAHTHER